MNFLQLQTKRSKFGFIVARLVNNAQPHITH